MTLALIPKSRLTALSVFALACVVSLPVAAQSLDYDVFKTKVEPIFLQKRPSHARCVVCHAAANHAFSLQPLDKGATTWTEEESRKNFEMVSRIVRPGNPDASLLLRQPLAHEAGGQEFHSGDASSRLKTIPPGRRWRTGSAPPSRGCSHPRGVTSKNIAVFSRRNVAKPSRAKNEVWLVTANNSLTPRSRALWVHRSTRSDARPRSWKSG